MKYCTALLASVLFLPAWGLTAAEPAPEATALIAELGLRESESPVSAMAGWAPRKIVVAMPFGRGVNVEEYKASLRAAAGDVELVFNEASPHVLTAQLLQGADAVIGMCMPPLMQRADENLRWLHSYLVGVDKCLAAVGGPRENTVFTNNQRLSAPSIAEHTIAMLLSLSRNLPAYQRAQDKAQWRRQLAAGVTFGELKGKTLLVAGLGGIGTEIARRAHGLGMRVVATRNSSRSGPDFVDYVGLADELPKLAAQADVVANALPLTENTTALFDKAFFAAVRPGAIFLSVGRGESTVTVDLIAALESGQLYGAGLDVTDPEPLPASSPLWSMDNVIITPHASATGAENTRRSAIIAVENLRRYVAGERLLNVVNIERGY